MAMERVLITGMGTLCSLGDSAAAFGDSLLAGRSGLRLVERLDYCLPERPVAVTADVSEVHLHEAFDQLLAETPAEWTGRLKAIRRSSVRPAALALYVGLQALRQADLRPGSFEASRVGVLAAAHNINHVYLRSNAQTYFEDDPVFIDPEYALSAFDTDLVGSAASAFGLSGPAFTVGAACASGNVALVQALGLIRAGTADAMLVIGASGEWDVLMAHNLVYLGAMTSGERWLDCPEQASRPFDGEREGFVMGFGYAAVFLESEAFHRQRQTSAGLAVLAGGALGSCMERGTRLDALIQQRVIEQALIDGGLAVEQLGYVNAHATSTVLGDRAEGQALRAVLGERLGQVPINATKSMTGHTIYASGVLSLVATVLQMQAGWLHPTLNQVSSDVAFDGFDLVPNVSRQYSFEHALSNGFGFGGLMASIVISRV